MTPDILHTAAHLATRVLHEAAARLLPWASRSQHDAYLNGYQDGGRDGYRQGYLAGCQDEEGPKL